MSGGGSIGFWTAAGADRITVWRTTDPGCRCGVIHVDLWRDGEVVARIDLTADRAEEIARGLCAAVTEVRAESLTVAGHAGGPA